MVKKWSGIKMVNFIDWIGLVSFFFFNGKSPFMDYSKPRQSLQWYYLTHCWGDKEVHTFPKGISPKVNVLARLEFELAYYDVTIQYISPHTTETPPLHTHTHTHTTGLLYVQMSKMFNENSLLKVKDPVYFCYVSVYERRNKENRLFSLLGISRPSKRIFTEESWEFGRSDVPRNTRLFSFYLLK